MPFGEVVVDAALQLLRAHLQRRVAALGQWQFEQRRKAGDELVERHRILRQPRLEAREVGVGRIARHPADDAAHMLDDRKHRAAGVEGRAAQRRARRALLAQLRQQCGGERRLADSRLAGEQHHLSMPALRLLPSAAQQADLLVAADELRRRARGGGLGLVGRLQLAADGIGLYRIGDALEAVRAEVTVLERVTGQLARQFGDDDRVRLGECLQSRGEVGGLADRGLWLIAFTVADDDEACRNTDPHRELMARFEPRHRVDQIERSVQRAPRIIAMATRPAEIHHHAVAEELREVAVVALDDLPRRGLVTAHQLAQILRVERARQRC